MSMKSSSKYYPLFDYLQRCNQPEITLSIAEIEALIDRSLPASAHSKKAWWSNRDSPNALQASAWIGAGYHTESVDLNQQTVTFSKFQAHYNIQQINGEIVWNQDAIKALRKHMRLTQTQFAQELGVRRQTVSEWENGVYQPDRSTAKHLERIAEQYAFQISNLDVV